MPTRVYVTAAMTVGALPRNSLGAKSVEMTGIAGLIAMDTGKLEFGFTIVIEIQFRPFGLRMALITALTVFAEVNIPYLMTTDAPGCFELILLTGMTAVALQLLVPAKQCKFCCIMVKYLTLCPTLTLVASVTFFPQ